jgi:mRNA interferase MazF
MLGVVVSQYSVYLVDLDPTKGSEMRKTRPCVVLSPDEMNPYIDTVQVAPLTSNTRAYPWRCPVHFKNKSGVVALDHMRSIDKSRIIKKSGKLKSSEMVSIKSIIREMLVD